MATSSRTRKSGEKLTPLSGKETLVPLHLSITPELHAKLKRIAKQSGKSLPEAATILLAVNVEKHEKLVGTIKKTVSQVIEEDTNQVIAAFSSFLPAKDKKRVSN